jgi:hypothetical protein
MKTASNYLLVFLMIVLASTVVAAVPQSINYQGYLTDAGRLPVNGTTSITFSLYTSATGTSSLWTETQQSVPVANGVYSAVLGSVTPLTLPFDTQYYLGVQTGTDDEMTPRHELTSAPYALRAVTAEKTVCIPGDFHFCYSGPQATLNVGNCKAGTRSCSQEGVFGICINEVLSQPEVCNGIDDNCNGVVDEGDPGGGGGCNTGMPGVCVSGTIHCQNGALVCVSNQQPSAEVCNGIDDNCNGVIDEGNPGGGGACNTGKLGVCAAGTVNCQNGALVCTQNQQPSTEVCNGLDDNCNGVVDEGNPGGGVACNTGMIGVCAAGTTSCQNGAIVCTQNQQPSTEVCNGLDDNCNGVVDEGDPGGGSVCNTGMQGVCAAGTTHCQNGTLVCTVNQTPTAEVCNGLDDNCNGVIDEGDPGGGFACNTGTGAGTTHCQGGVIVCVPSGQ